MSPCSRWLRRNWWRRVSTLFSSHPFLTIPLPLCPSLSLPSPSLPLFFSSKPKTNLVHSRAVRRPLVAIILNVLKCVFYGRSVRIEHKDKLHYYVEWITRPDTSWVRGTRPMQLRRCFDSIDTGETRDTQRPWSFCKTCVAMKFVDDDDDDDDDDSDTPSPLPL